MRLSVFTVLTMTLCLATFGCIGSAIHQAGTEVPREATPIVIDETIKSLENPETRKRIDAVLSDPGVRASIRSISADIASGALASLGTEETSARIDALVTQIVDSASRELGKGIEREIAPAIQRAVIAGLTQALGPEQRKAIAAEVASSSVELSRGVAQTVGTEIVPALIRSLQVELQKPEVQTTLGGASERASHGMILGTASAVQEIQARSGEPTLRQRLSRALYAVVIVSALAGGILVGLGAFVLYLRRKAKVFEERSARQDAIATRFIGALQALRGKSYAEDLFRSFDAAIAAGPGAEELRQVLTHVGASPLPRLRKRRGGLRRSPPRDPEHGERTDADRTSH
jgi:hypothetical protein